MMKKKLLLIGGMSLVMMTQTAYAKFVSNKEIAKLVCDTGARIERQIVDAAFSKNPLPYEEAQKYLQQELEKVKKADSTPNSFIYQLVSQITTKGVEVTYSVKYFTAGSSKAFGTNVYVGMSPAEIKIVEPMTLKQFKEFYLKSAYSGCVANIEGVLNKSR